MTDTALIKAGNGGSIVERHEFGAIQAQSSAETAGAAVAAREQAMIQARFIMAERHPRNIEQFRVEIQEHCKQKSFADAAWFSRPVGKEKNQDSGEWEMKYAEGLSIRFMEAAVRLYRNISTDVMTVFENDSLRICRVIVTDLETATVYSTEVQVKKLIEKRGFKDRKGKFEPPKGRDVVSERINTQGETTYLVLATDDEVLSRQNNLLSKAIRTLEQRLLPPDVLEECREIVLKTREADIASDPKKAVRDIIDAFASISVDPVELEAFLGKKVDRAQPRDIQQLRDIFKAIRDGETTWEAILTELNPEHGSREEQGRVAQRKLASLRGKQDPGPAEQKPEAGAEDLQAQIDAAERAIKAALANPVDRLPSIDDGEPDDGVYVAVREGDTLKLCQWSAANGSWKVLREDAKPAPESEAGGKKQGSIQFPKGKKS